jgi:tetratricopeptide (TPR) repeat protein
MTDLTAEQAVKLSTTALRLSAPLLWRFKLAPWREKAACVFYQAGVERHRRLFLSEIVADLEASGSKGDPSHAARQAGLLHAVDDEARERVARYYEAAIAYLPHFAEPLYNLASLRRDCGRKDEALALFLRAGQARPHSRAKPHALVIANAFWEAATIMVTLDRLEEAEKLFRRALSLNKNFGPDHVRFPRLLQRIGKNVEALDHFELAMTYSHRYAPEFIEPEYQPDELAVRQPDGVLFDPFELNRIEGTEILYWAHLYFRVRQGLPVTSVLQLQKMLMGGPGTERRSIRCSQTKGALET